MKELIGKTISKADVNGFGINLTFTDGTEFCYDATDGGYSGWELTSTEESSDEDYFDDYDEVGFNPYMGCYDFDC